MAACGIGFVVSQVARDHGPSFTSRAGLQRGAIGPPRPSSPVRPLPFRKDDPAALRLLARASARLGRDDAAMAIYQRRLDEKALEAEDLCPAGADATNDRGRPTRRRRPGTKCSKPGRGLTPIARRARLAFMSRVVVGKRRSRSPEQLSRQPGWEARGSMMLGTIRVELNDVPAAAESFRRALDLDPAEVDKSHDPIPLRKLIARTFLRTGRPDEARPLLQSILDRGPDQEAAWLLSRVFLQEGDKARGAGGAETGRVRTAPTTPWRPSPARTSARPAARSATRPSSAIRSPAGILRATTVVRSSTTLPLPDRPLPDPDDPEVTHTFQSAYGALSRRNARRPRGLSTRSSSMRSGRATAI